MNKRLHNKVNTYTENPLSHITTTKVATVKSMYTEILVDKVALSADMQTQSTSSFKLPNTHMNWIIIFTSNTSDCKHKLTMGQLH